MNTMISVNIIRRAGVVIAAALVAVALTGIAPAGASASTCAAWTGTQPPNPGGPSNENNLGGVAVLSSCNAWAVGRYDNGTAFQTLIEHWNGSSWTQAASPNPGGPSNDNELTGVAATSSTNAWAVGSSPDNGGKTLIEHWNGTAWQQVASPNPGSPSSNYLFGVAATSSTNAWAVGSYNNLHGAQATLIEHWNGTAWRQVASPNPGGVIDELVGVAATSATNAWAVGHSLDGTAWRTLIEHWNGTAWRQEASPSPGSPAHVQSLDGVTATSARNAWAVGRYRKGTTTKTLIEHWNGTAWRQEASLSPSGRSSLGGVAATSSSNAWAVGSSNGGGKTLIEHWNGRGWAQVPSPNPGGVHGSFLLGVAATSATNIWAVGSYNNGTNLQTLALHCC
jgi:hypothetical protein